MEKAHLAILLMKLAPLSLCGFVLALVEKKKKDFSGYLGDNFPATGPSFRFRLKRK
ncbi:hypothetical protein ACFL5X_00220 [Candidatus Omnitrophota bacterium]